jgi:hypothetical protein
MATLLAIACAVAIGAANHIDLVNRFQAAIFLLLIGIAMAIAAVAFVSIREKKLSERNVFAVLITSLLLQAIFSVQEGNGSATSLLEIGAVACLGISLLYVPSGWRMWVVALAIVPVACLSIHHLRQTQHEFMDVRYFQKRGSQYLLQGQNPFSGKYINVYQPGAPFYGPGIVDRDDNLTVGFPYPPLSLLMVLPAEILKTDLRLVDLAAIALSALLMASARPTRFSAMAAVLFLLTPKTQTILEMAWTEPLLVLTFSFVMFCAFRWPRALPYALGLFLSSKQYAVLAVPLFPLLAGKGDCRKWPSLMAKACFTALAINLPFVLWNPHAIYRSVVQFQLLQPFREDSLSIAALISRTHGGYQLPMFVSLLAIIAAFIAALRLAPRTPAGFAAALTLVCLLFFALSKQAFCNYYYFTIATAVWAVAASTGPRKARRQMRQSSDGNPYEVQSLSTESEMTLPSAFTFTS